MLRHSEKEGVVAFWRGCFPNLKIRKAVKLFVSVSANGSRAMVQVMQLIYCVGNESFGLVACGI
jgi:hypothetical protein